MPLNIKDEKTYALARQVAEATGVSLTRAVHDALEEQLKRVALARKPESLRDELNAIALRAAARPAKTTLSLEQLLYDENGLPK